MKNATAKQGEGVIPNHPLAVEESISARDYLNTVTSPR